MIAVRALGLALLSIVMGLGTVARADFIDNPNDFLAGYAGPRNGDLDVLSSNVIYNAATGQMTVTATMNGVVGSTVATINGVATPVNYVWGFNRGTGTAAFAAIGVDNVVFDSVVSVLGNGTASIRLIPEAQSITIDPTNVVISGNTLRATFAASLLTGRGFALPDYTWNLWPRLGGGNNNQISDFAPDNANLRIETVPEPNSGLLTGAGLAVLGRIISGRRRRSS